MPQVSGVVPNLINGISQQAPTLRLPSQAEASENYYPTLVDGLTKRPRTDHRAVLATLPADTFTHFILRDAAEEYVVAILTNGTIRVWDFAGSEKTVNNQGASYLSGMVNAKEDLRALTVIDHTFIVNTKKAVQAGTATAPTRPFEALINVMAGNYAKNYKVYINGTLASNYRPPDGSASSHAKWIDTTHIANELYTGLNTARSGNSDNDSEWFGLGGFNVAPWATARYNSTVYLRNSSSDFAIAVEDGFGGRAMVAVKGRAQRFTDLPTYGPDGVVVEIAGSDANSFDNYWVQFQKGNDANSAGVWKECVAPGSRLGLNAATMPHILVREGDGSFTFKAATWDNRKCGNVATVPDPSFVGTTIQDVFFNKNRLGFLTADNVVMSSAGQFYNFYRSTLTALLDTDPIDTAASHTKVAKLRHAILFNRELLAFSDNTQFVVKGNELMAPRTVNADPVTEFSISPRVAPVGSKASLFFVSEGDRWARLYEYFVDKAMEAADGDDVSSHAPTYIPAGVNRLITSADQDLVLMSTDGDPDAIYCYKFFWNGQEKLQSAWSRWTYPGATIVNMVFDRSNVHVLLKRGGVLHLESFTAEQSVIDADLSYAIYLDRSVVRSNGVYNSTTKETTFTLPYTAPSGLQAVTVPGGSLPAGVEFQVQASGTSARIAGNLTGQPVRFGVPYASVYELSRFFHRGQDGRTVDEAGRLQVAHLSVTYAKSAYFRVEVTCQGRPVRSYTFNGRIIGDQANKTGELVTANGRLSMPVLSRSDRVTIKLINDTWLPCAFASAKWRGTWNPNSREM
jgi:hypothetical protein